jgi:hypothetical protein
MRLTSTGLGIGTSSPQTKIQATGSSAGAVLDVATVRNDSSDANSEVGIFFNPSDQATNIRGARISAINDGGNNVGLKFYTGTGATITSKMTLDFSGNLGIGTSSPAYKLDVLGSSGSISTARVYNGNTGGSDGAQILLGNSANFTNAYFRLNGGGNSSQAGAGSLNIGVAQSVPMAFYTANTERMRITSAGNVGIGTSSPDAALQVVAAGNRSATFTRTATSPANDTYALRVDNSAQTANVSVSGAVAVDVNSGRAFTINGLGNVGIGTSSPSASAILDAQSTTKGVRMPNMTTAQKNAIASPAAGLMVYDTTLAKLCVYTTAWETITSI